MKIPAYFNGARLHFITNFSIFPTKNKKKTKLPHCLRLFSLFPPRFLFSHFPEQNRSWTHLKLFPLTTLCFSTPSKLHTHSRRLISIQLVPFLCVRSLSSLIFLRFSAISVDFPLFFWFFSYFPAKWPHGRYIWKADRDELTMRRWPSVLEWVFL